MSRRDFELIAWTLRRYAEDRNGGRTPCGLAEAFAVALAGTNSRFDRERFLRACEPTVSVADAEGVVKPFTDLIREEEAT